MFYVILFIAFVVMFVKSILSSEEDYAASWFIISLLTGILLFITICSGVRDYSGLSAKYDSIQNQRIRIIDIQKSYYPQKEQGTMISGSIENLSQSKILSEAILALTEIESNYIESRKKAIIAMDSKIYFWFLDGLFIPKEVRNLPELKSVNFKW